MKSTSKTTNTPKLRFPEFTGDWECRKLGEVVEKVKSYSLSRNVEVAEFTGFKYIHYGDIHRGVANIIHSDEILPDIQTGNFELLKQGDLVLADASEDYEGVGACCVIDCFSKNNLVAGLHTIAIRPIKTDHLFLYYLLNTQTFKRYGRFVGTGTKVVAISPTNLLKFKTNIPTNPSEQTTIGNFFHQLDKLITLHQRKLDNVKTLKKGLLQKMFPAQGETVPQLRFPQFTDAWEQRKFGDVWQSTSVRNTNLEFGANDIISVAQMKLAPSENKSSDEYMKTYNILRVGDIAFEGNKSKKFAFGRFVLNDLQDGIVSHVFNVYRPCIEMDISFMKTYINNENVMRHILVKATTKTVMMTTLNAKDIVKQNIYLPTLAEQTTIGNFFRQVDELITLHQRKLGYLKMLKKALLQQMFV